MRSKRVSQTVDAFNKLEKAQLRYQKLFDDLSEEEEGEFERRLFSQDVKIYRLGKKEEEEKP